MSSDQMNRLLQSLTQANAAYRAQYGGDLPLRQPVTTVYGGAHLFKCNTTLKIRDVALKSFQEYISDAKTLQEIFGLESLELARIIYSRVEEKLKREAVEDFRIDFEDGFGQRADAEEDSAAIATARELARGMKEGTLPPFIGIRIKAMSDESKGRALRTLDLFVATLAEETQGKLPANFTLTLPKVVNQQQIKVCVDALEIVETHAGLPPGSIPIELMIETPQSIFGSSGEIALLSFVAASQGRCRGVHFGAYDYTASLDITASQQTLDHPACDFARQVMKIALAGTGVWLSDGATNIMPVAIHREPKDAREKAENREAVHSAWRLNYGHIQHSLRNGYYQGWDLHPAQLPVRYAALYAFFLKDLDATSRRLRVFIEQAAKATLQGNVFDDAATGQGLLNYFLRALNSGAITEDEILKTGLGLGMDEIRTRSFKKILEGRIRK